MAALFPGVRLVGMPDFNRDDPAFVVTGFDGWYASAVPDVVLVGNGGGPGAVASGPWDPVEAYLVLRGSVGCVDQADVDRVRRLLLAALPPNVEVPLIVLDASVSGADRQTFVRRYDAPDMEPVGFEVPFAVPLVAADPYKYGLAPLAGDVGVFTGERWYRNYVSSTGQWVRTYAQSGSRWVRTYTQSAPTGALPVALPLTSDGDAPSQRMTVAVTGPLDAGDWWLSNEATGARLWAELAVSDQQTLVFDVAAKTAFLSGSDVTHLVSGDWLSLEPGTNTFRLTAGSASPASARFDALPAYQ